MNAKENVSRTSALYRCNGSALVESFLIVGVMVTFMIGIPMIGKLIDLKQTAVQASRYSAWEKTVIPNAHNPNLLDANSDVQNVDARFFMDAAAPIRSTMATDTGANYLWGGIRSGGGEADAASGGNEDSPPEAGNMELYQKSGLTLTPGSVRSPTTTVAEDGLAYTTAGTIVAKIGAAISPDGWNDGDPLRNGLVMSTVEARVKANAMFSLGGDKCGSGDEGCVTESTAILIDGWSAAEPGHMRERIHGFVPTNRLQKLGNFVSKLKALPMFDDLEHLDKAFGCVKTNIVPQTKDFAPVGNSPLPPFPSLPEEDC